MTTARTITIADAALAYHARGWKPVPVSRKTKKPIGMGWQKRPFDLAQFNGNAQNIAIQIGAVSGGLIDVDLDTMLAVGLAPEFLPPTGAIFGRQSKPCSHHLYMTDLCATEKLAAIAYKEFVDGRANQVLVELRIGGGTKGAATVFPPSMHTSGEVVQWVSDGEPARVPGNELKRAVLKLAVACLLEPRYPGQGSRHEGALVLGGMLARSGWSADDIRHVVEVLGRRVGDDDVPDRIIAATSAVNVKANGHDVAGLTRFGFVDVASHKNRPSIIESYASKSPCDLLHRLNEANHNKGVILIKPARGPEAIKVVQQKENEALYPQIARDDVTKLVDVFSVNDLDNF